MMGCNAILNGRFALNFQLRLVVSINILQTLCGDHLRRNLVFVPFRLSIKHRSSVYSKHWNYVTNIQSCIQYKRTPEPICIPLEKVVSQKSMSSYMFEMCFLERIQTNRIGNHLSTNAAIKDVICQKIFFTAVI